ncbi:STAS domain-containing protein [Actinoplanes sp. NPDC049681]|uniref:STAS domain-containing protein n=1 Tax=Actinoplanes sp. NPDC049681 TaxID=3363905 RepID=UPI0037A72B43
MSEILQVTTHDPADGVRVLRIAGELDRDSVAVLRTEIEDALEEGVDRLIVDVTSMEFCDSGGLSLFVETHRRTAARGGWLRLAGPRPAVRNVLETTNLTGYLNVHSHLEAALE